MMNIESRFSNLLRSSIEDISEDSLNDPNRPTLLDLTTLESHSDLARFRIEFGEGSIIIGIVGSYQQFDEPTFRPSIVGFSIINLECVVRFHINMQRLEFIRNGNGKDGPSSGEEFFDWNHWFLPFYE
jgi:hypothetical protein